ncbi:hypothetical protein [Paludibacterium paludis]|uniref:DUF4148 domain-containing protein n=1 Tax=Paludibacterium paludis TaxID=1225769 RepID=A0A918P134_9NEIS|nr:hypothetical protein [Paludibacterium paludis]GGY12645.1 hypothetical protein GCM10011289_14900 [Paludibacterium paludis]
MTQRNLAWTIVGCLLAIASAAEAGNGRPLSLDRSRLEGGMGHGAASSASRPVEPSFNASRLRDIRLREAVRDGDITRDEAFRLRSDPSSQSISFPQGPSRERPDALGDTPDIGRKPKSFWREHRKKAIDTNGAETQ